MTTTAPRGRSYVYTTVRPSHSQRYLNRPLRQAIHGQRWPEESRALDYGCGSGWWAGQLAEMKFKTLGVDISESGVALARRTFPHVEFTTDVSKDSLKQHGPFDLVTCIEVIAHCYTPLLDLQTMYDCLKPAGRLVLTTPYHGYFKNLAMALTGKLERHLDTAWSGSYVHFFSRKSLSVLLTKVGFEDLVIVRVGRIAPLANSMIVTCTKPK